MACRDTSKATAAISTHPNKSQFIPIKLNLGSQVSIREFSQRIHSDYSDGINCLVNNAGVYAIGNPDRMETDDGNELHFGTNYLGHYTLSLLLLDLLRKGAMYSNSDSRIVTVSSALYKSGQFNFNDLELKMGYTPEKAYANSKLGNILMTKMLYEKLQRDRTGQPGAGRIRVYTTHPGIVRTDLSRYYTTNVFRRFMWWIAGKLILRTPEQGILASVECIEKSTKDLDDGGYYGNGLVKVVPVKNDANTLVAIAKDDDLAKKLFEISSEMTGVKLEADCNVTVSGPTSAMMF